MQIKAYSISKYVLIAKLLGALIVNNQGLILVINARKDYSLIRQTSSAKVVMLITMALFAKSVCCLIRKLIVYSVTRGIGLRHSIKSESVYNALIQIVQTVILLLEHARNVRMGII